jgi:rRNA maturation endonuclease Nob1
VAHNDDTAYKLICDSCAEEYTISAYKTEEIPQHCPFCGHEIDVTEFDEEEEEIDEEDTLDFDDDH